jgi:leucyl-tRNA synthetase
MSKSRGNVINPDDIVREFGADTFRLYEMFMGPLEASKPWSTKGVDGPRRFLERVYRLYTEVATVVDHNENLDRVYHQTVKKVTNDYENLRFNTAISQMMIFINECYKDTNVPYEYLIGFLKLLNPIAPHLTEELYSQVFNKHESIAYTSWPTYDEEKTLENKITVIVQVNGKIRDKIDVAVDTPTEELEKAALASAKVQNFINGQPVRKIITVPNKLVNIVI